MRCQTRHKSGGDHAVDFGNDLAQVDGFDSTFACFGAFDD